MQPDNTFNDNPYSSLHMEGRRNIFPPIPEKCNHASSGAHAEVLATYEHLLEEKQYSRKTITNYKKSLATFLKYFAPRLPPEISCPEIVCWIEEISLEQQLSVSYQNSLINAIKAYYQMTGASQHSYKIPRPRQVDHNPCVISRADIQSMIRRTDNLKHKCILMLAYGVGLRLGEILSLVPGDIDKKRMLMHIRHKKGGAYPERSHTKDREVPIPPRLLEYLLAYLSFARPRIWLFEGAHPGEPYSERSIQLIVKQAAARAGVRGSVSLYALRHSYAAHLIEAGADLRYVQELLGHNQIKTTGRYAHIARHHYLVSPMESMEV